MNKRDWLSLIAVHSDCWLLSVAFYLGARLNRSERKRLFGMINDLQTVFEIVTERKVVKDKPNADSGSKSRGSTKTITKSTSPKGTYEVTLWKDLTKPRSLAYFREGWPEFVKEHNVSFGDFMVFKPTGYCEFQAIIFGPNGVEFVDFEDHRISGLLAREVKQPGESSAVKQTEVKEEPILLTDSAEEGTQSKEVRVYAKVLKGKGVAKPKKKVAKKGGKSVAFEKYEPKRGGSKPCKRCKKRGHYSVTCKEIIEGESE